MIPTNRTCHEVRFNFIGTFSLFMDSAAPGSGILNVR